MEPQEQESRTDLRYPRYAPSHAEAIIKPNEIEGLEPQSRVLVRLAPGSVGLFSVWRNNTGPHETQGVWAEPIWDAPDQAIRLANGNGPSPALLEHRVVVSRQSLGRPNERYVWWCECGTASEKGFHGTEGFREARKCLARHRRDKKCSQVCGVASHDNLEARKAWAQVWFNKIKKKERDS